MSLDTDVRAARQAVVALDQACHAVAQHFGDSVDVRRLRTDVARVREDLDLLCGAERAAEARPLEVIEDREYEPDFWQGAEDEGLGVAGHRAP